MYSVPFGSQSPSGSSSYLKMCGSHSTQGFPCWNIPILEYAWLQAWRRGPGEAHVALPLGVVGFPKGGSIQDSLLLPLK